MKTVTAKYITSIDFEVEVEDNASPKEIWDAIIEASREAYAGNCEDPEYYTSCNIEHITIDDDEVPNSFFF